MNIEATKLELIEWIINLENEDTLKALKEIKDSDIRAELGKKLEIESKLISAESLKTLSDFEKLEDEV